MGMVDRKRIAKNTLLLYIRMGLIMAVSLYASRIVLEALGETDFGLYNVIGGIVVAFSFLNGVMNAACNRYYSVELGRQDYDKLHKVFSINVVIFLVLSAIILVLSETVGLWIFEQKMNIPAERHTAAAWVYQISIVAFILSMIAIPFKSIITAKEKMKVYAYCSMVEAVLRLGAVFLLAVAPLDRLIFYALMMLAINFGTSAFYILYCLRFYNECRFPLEWDKALAKEIISFNGWGVIGSMATIGKAQGVNILLNMFFGPAVNAARGVANQVYVNVYQFVQNYVLAFNPQIVKSHAAGEREEMTKLVFQSSKFCYFLLFVIVLPLVLEINQVLDIWLVEVPAHSASFATIMLASALVDSMHDPLYYSVQASGKVKWYNILVGSSQLLIVVLAYIMLKTMEVEPEYVFVVIFIFTVIAQIIRIILTHRYVGIRYRDYLRFVILPVVAITVISPLVPWYISTHMEANFTRLVLTVLASIVTVGLSVFVFGLEKDERRNILKLLKRNGE